MKTNEVVLVHPSGTRVVLIGTKHVSCRDGDQVASAIAHYSPQTVVLEVDEERYQQLHFRLAHLMNHDTATLMRITAGQHDEEEVDGSSSGDRQHSSNQQGGCLQSILPDALLWRQHHQQFQLMRNEGVPLLLGSLYGSDMLQAALAAAAAAASQRASQPAAQPSATAPASQTAAAVSAPIQIVLADQEQHVTMQRFRALADGMGQLKQLLSSLMGVAHAEALSQPSAMDSAVEHDATHLSKPHVSLSSCRDITANTVPTGSVNSSDSNSAPNVSQPQQYDLVSGSSNGSTMSCPYPAQPEIVSGSSSHKSIGDATSHVSAIISAMQQVVVPLLSSAMLLAASRLYHLCMQWWLMALSSQQQWYGAHVHPVFWLAGNEQMQVQLEDAGVTGVRPAAAATARLLQCAARSSLSSSDTLEDACMPAAKDIAAIRECVESMEAIGWAVGNNIRRDSATAFATTASIGKAVDNDLSNSISSVGSSSSGLHSDMPMQPWWASWQSRLSQQHQQSNSTAVMAYEQAVMVERNAVLVDAIWEQAHAASANNNSNHCSSSSSGSSSDGTASSLGSSPLWGFDKQQQLFDGPSASHSSIGAPTMPKTGPVVLGVVGVNHLAGMQQQWANKQQDWQLSHRATAHRTARGSFSDGDVQTPAWGSSAAPFEGAKGSNGMAFADTNHCFTSRFTSSCASGSVSSSELLCVDMAADALESCAVGAIGLGYWLGVKRFCGGFASAEANRLLSPHGAGASNAWRLPLRMKRLGLLMAPVVVALLPLQRDAHRFQEASDLFVKVARVNDVMMDEGRYGGGASSLMRLI